MPEDALDRIFMAVVGVDLKTIDQSQQIDYNKFLDTMRKEFST